MDSPPPPASRTFEVKAVASLASAQQGSILKFASNKETIVVTIAKNFFLYDRNKSNVKKVDLLFPIECVKISTKSKFAFLCDQSSNIHVLDIPKNEIISQSSHSNDSPCIEFLCFEKSNNDFDIVNFYEDGSIICTSFHCGESAEKGEDVVASSNYRLPRETKISSAVTLDHEDNSFLVAGSAMLLCTIASNNLIIECQTVILEDNVFVTKLQTSPDSSIIYALKSNGSLIEVCRFSLLILRSVDFNYHVTNFVIINSQPHKQILTNSIGHENTSVLQLINLEGLQIIYTVIIEGLVDLIPLNTFEEELLFIERKNEGNGTDAICIKAIQESDPQDRIFHLLQQHKFEDAKMIALEHNLDLQTIFKKEAQHYTNLMSQTTEANSGSSYAYDISKLILLLDKVDDLAFVSHCCLRALPHNILQSREILYYCKRRLCDFNHMDYSIISVKISNQIKKLDTLELLFDASQIFHFMETNLPELCFELLKMNELGKATLLLKRHTTEVFSAMSEDDVLPFIESLQSHTEISLLINFLEAFVPTVMRQFPGVVSKVIIWLNTKTKDLEWEDTSLWPESAFDFSRKTLEILDNLHWTWNIIQHQESQELRMFHHTNKVLRELLCLKHDHNISLSTDQYHQDDHFKVCNLLLSRTAPQDTATFIHKFLRQYTQEAGINLQVVLTSYVEFITSNHSWWCYESMPCETQLIVIIKSLSCLKNRLSCIVVLVRAAPVPWSEPLVQLIEEYVNCKHEKALELRKEKDAAVAKIILQKYQICDVFVLISNGLFECRVIAQHILKHGGEDCLKEAIAIQGINSNHVANVYSLFIEFLLTSGSLSTASKLLDNLSGQLKVSVCKKSALKVYIMLKNEMVSFMDPLCPIIDLIVQHLKSSLGQGFLSKKDWLAMKNITEISRTYVILQKYCSGSVLESTLKTNFPGLFYSETHKLQFYLNCINQILGFESCVVNAKILARILDLHEVEAVLVLVEASCAQNLYDLAIEALVSLLESTTSITDQCTKSLICLTKSSLERPPKISSVYYKFLNTLQHSLCIFLSHCNIEYADQLLDIWNTISLLESEPISKPSPLECCLEAVYEDTPVSFKTNVSLLQDYLGRMWKFNDNPGDAHQLNFTCKQLWSNKCEFLSLMLVGQMISRSLAAPQHEFEFLLSLYQTCIEVLFPCVIKSARIDQYLGIELLLSTSPQKALDWLKESIKRSFHENEKIEDLTILAITYSIVTSNLIFLEKMKPIYVSIVWEKRLKLLGISNTDIVRKCDKASTSRVLMNMVQQCPCLELETIQKFCDDFGIEYTRAIFGCLEYLILTWQPDQLMNMDNKNITIQQYTRVLEKAESYVKSISKKFEKELKTIINRIWEKVSPYNYEMFICLLHLKSILNDKDDQASFKILSFLTHYQRQSKPLAEELQSWISSNPEGCSLPSISSTRLPFHLYSSNPEKLIEVEVNLQNYIVWLKAPNTCDVNQICDAAIQNSINQNIPNEDTPNANIEKWCEHQSQNDNLVTEIVECVGHMTESSVICKVLDSVCYRIPPGAVKLQLLELTLQKIHIWSQQAQSPEVTKMEENVLKKFQLYATYQVLHEQRLSRKDYLDLAIQPLTLIRALYTDPSIFERCGHINEKEFPDIHHTVNRIGTIYKLNVSDIREQLLQTRLHNGSICSQDVSYVWQEFHQTGGLSITETSNEYAEFCYLLKSEDMLKHLDLLIRLCFNPGSTNKTNVKLMALYSIVNVFSINVVCQHTGRTDETLRNYAKTLFFSNEVEKVGGSNMMPAEFDKKSVKPLVHSLFQMKSYNPNILCMCCHICHSYGIYDLKLWASLFGQMTELKMFKQLECILPKLNHMTHLLICPQFVTAWKEVIRSPFDSLNTPSTKKQEDSCFQVIKILPECPILQEINLKFLFKQCLKKHRLDIAAILLPLTPFSDRATMIQELQKLADIENLIIQLKALGKYMFLPIEEALKIVQGLHTSDPTSDKTSPELVTLS